MKRNIDNWTKEEETFLRENYRKVSTETLSYLLKKDKDAIYRKASKLKLSKRKWLKEEDEYLERSWGRTSITSIAEHLGRSELAVKERAQKMRLGSFLDAGGYVTLFEFLRAIGQESNYYYLNMRLERDGFPIKYKTKFKEKVKIVDIDEFWKWIEKNPSKLDFSNFEKNALGPEPKWVEKKRIDDKLKKKKFSTKPWTNTEDKRLIEALNMFKYSYKELSQMLNRTEGAIQRRIIDLGLKQRPIRISSHNKWTEEEFEKLTECINNKVPYSKMTEVIDKSEKAIRGKIYNMYLSESIDKAAQYMQGKQFGYNRPDRNILHNTLNSEERINVKDNILRFCDILKAEMKKKYNETDYWQSQICQNFSVKCLKEHTCCDECLEFKRIQPQYCNRCGAVIMSRNKENICDRCKKQRIKQYQKKYMALKDKNKI